ncbi:MAG TPA: AtpZ/AtpI family protein [Candidatus Limnocylindrales bacterium]|jgi:F0F1-type ATP synthase assembly protein I
MIEPGRGWAYFALFSEIGFALLVATLAGALGGVWLDRQVGTTPLFVLIGLFIGLAAGARIAYRLITRFLAQSS